MSTETKKTLAAAGVFVSIITGAGFATGRELLTFFAGFGPLGALGFALACAVLGLCGWAVMDISWRKPVSGYKAFMELLLGRRFGGIMVALCNVFIFVMMTAMLAGGGAAAAMISPASFPISTGTGALILAILCFITFLFDLKGIMSVSLIFAPVLILGGLFFGIHAAITATTPVFLGAQSQALSFLWPAVIYASYNLLTSVAVLSILGAQIGSPRAARRAAFIAGGTIFVLGLAFLAPIYIHYPSLQNIPVPLLALAEASGGAVEGLYILVLFTAIFTTAVANGFAVIEWLNSLILPRFPWAKTPVKAAVALGGAALAQLGFSTFIDVVYPAFGYIGLFQIAAVLVYFVAGKKA